MSSPHDAPEDTGETQSHEELDGHQPGVDAAEDPTSTQTKLPVKRNRGRPPGSKNKKPAVQSSANAAASSSVPRKRGRPPKPKTEDTGEEPPPKRGRGRPRKNPQPTESTEAQGSEAPQRKKRGRPKKTTT